MLTTTLERPTSLLDVIRQVGEATCRPEQLVLRWREDPQARNPLLIVVLLGTAVLGMAAYGLVMRMHLGVGGMLEGAVLAPMAAGLAWATALPALYIVGAALGSELDASTTLMAACATVAFGAMAMLASIPVTWFFYLSVAEAPAIATAVRVGVNVLVFTGVGLCMVDTFRRIMRALEPERGVGFPLLWLGLEAFIGLELFTAFGSFAL